MQRLNEAWATLNAIKADRASRLAGPAFRYALVEYATPYNTSFGANKIRYQLSEQYVPAEHLELHRRIIAARNTVHAHADLSVLDAKLYLRETQGKPSASISSNYIHGLEELPNIEAIIELIEGTLLNMYADQEPRLSALRP
jgi:hypothetical protein